MEFGKLPLRFKPLYPVLAPIVAGMPKEHVTTDKIPSLLKFYGLMTKNVLQGVPEQFSTNTNWTDIAGSNDALSDSADHIALVRARNEALERQGLPKRSTVTILGSQPHAWTERSTTLVNTISHALHLGRGRRERIDVDHERIAGPITYKGKNKDWQPIPRKAPRK